MGCNQILPCYMTQAERLSFPYLKSYCPLNCLPIILLILVGIELPLRVVVTILECSHVFWSQVEYKIVCFILLFVGKVIKFRDTAASLTELIKKTI